MSCSVYDRYLYDRDVTRKRGGAIIGVDEAGRGPLAGPVVAAAVVLEPGAPIDGIDDSKKLSLKKRNALYTEITSSARDYAIASAEPEEIDRMNILQASLLAMSRAIAELHIPWTLALIDGNHEIPSIDRARQLPVVKGDSLSASIGAASILAKVRRDRIMEKYHSRYPVYEFAAHKGYATKRHRNLIRKHGVCPIHRKSFCISLLSEIVLPLEIKETHL
ncbi:MAG: ribonuclease HII [Chitinivibrionales bacterium]|nr:ribonuclease HII [Chitinivibrionales bacterium]